MRRKSGGGEVGVALGGQDFIAVYASVDIGKGHLDREAGKQQDAQLQAGQQLRFESGRDTTVAGARLDGQEVVGKVGRDLLVSSVPDTCKAREQLVQATVGAGEIIVRSDTETGHDSVAGLNRDASKAYEITQDKEKRTDLYVSK